MPRRRPEPLAVPNEPIGAELPGVAAVEAEPAVAAGASEGPPDVTGSDMCFLLLGAHPARDLVAKASRVVGERMLMRAHGAHGMRLDACVKE